MKNRQDPKPRRRAALVRGVAVALACMLVAAAWAANRSASQSPEQQGAAARSRPAAASARTAAIASAVTQAPAAKEWRYDAVVERNLFMPPPARRQEMPPALPPLAPMPIEAFTARPLGEAQAQPPEWTYAGYATADGSPVAIIENAGTKQAEFVRLGETFDGFVVSEVTPEAVQLTRSGETKVLRISEAFTATPLNEPPKPAAPPTPGQGRRGRGGFPGGGGPGAIFQAMRDNPEFADQARRFMENFMRPDQPVGPEPQAEGGTP